MTHDPQMVAKVARALARVTYASTHEDQAKAALEASHHAELVEALVLAEAALAGFSEEFLEKAGIGSIRAAIAKAERQ